jgi:RHS repeat-associated protein
LRLNARTRQITPDSTSQLTATDHSFQTDESYSYDANGNRTMTGYTTGTNNRLTGDGTHSYEYDDEGNRKTRTKTSTGEKTEYTWDHRNRLTRVIEKNASGDIVKQTDYTYDVFNRRLSKSIDADGAGPAAATVQRFVYFGHHIVMEFDGNNASDLTHRYLHGLVIDQILADEEVTSLTQAGTMRWPLADNLGTVRDIVDSSASVLNHLKYDAYGKVTSESNAAVDFLFAFTGRERDEETGLQFHRARYYDPAVGRWMSEDPIGFAAGDGNLARYVGNRVTDVTDRSGLDGFLLYPTPGDPIAIQIGFPADGEFYVPPPGPPSESSPQAPSMTPSEAFGDTFSTGLGNVAGGFTEPILALTDGALGILELWANSLYLSTGIWDDYHTIPTVSSNAASIDYQYQQGVICLVRANEAIFGNFSIIHRNCYFLELRFLLSIGA